MSEIKNVDYTCMALNTFKCNRLTPLHFKGLMCAQKFTFQLRSKYLLCRYIERVINLRAHNTLYKVKIMPVVRIQ